MKGDVACLEDSDAVEAIVTMIGHHEQIGPFNEFQQCQDDAVGSQKRLVDMMNIDNQVRSQLSIDMGMRRTIIVVVWMWTEEFGRGWNGRC